MDNERVQRVIMSVMADKPPAAAQQPGLLEKEMSPLVDLMKEVGDALSSTHSDAQVEVSSPTRQEDMSLREEQVTLRSNDGKVYTLTILGMSDTDAHHGLSFTGLDQLAERDLEPLIDENGRLPTESLKTEEVLDIFERFLIRRLRSA